MKIEIFLWIYFRRNKMPKPRLSMTSQRERTNECWKWKFFFFFLFKTGKLKLVFFFFFFKEIRESRVGLVGERTRCGKVVGSSSCVGTCTKCEVVLCCAIGSFVVVVVVVVLYSRMVANFCFAVFVVDFFSFFTF